MEPYKWYKPSELLPEDTDLPKNEFGVEGYFVVALNNGDLWCVTRWTGLEDSQWYWDADSDYYDSLIRKDGISHWMKIEKPEDIKK